MHLDGLSVILVHSRFPENIGMAARACANMGCGQIILVAPERFDLEKARMLATPQGWPLLDQLQFTQSLAETLAPFNHIYGTTARVGGWRKELQSPSQAAPKIACALNEKTKVALVFGPEDRGLTNAEITLCHELITIPTAEAHSLNLAQAVLLTLYEVAQAKSKHEDHGKNKPHITNQELTLFLNAFKQVLLKIDYLHGDNVDYFFQPWQRLFARVDLTPREWKALMGLCRQINTFCHKNS